MSTLEAIILGIIQGATEFLPISSTAHLRIIPALLGWKEDPGAAFTAVIQWGTLLAAVVYFWKDIVRILSGWFGLRTAQPFHGSDSRVGWQIIVGTLPIVVMGLLLQKRIKEDFRSLYVIAAALIVLAALLAVAEWWHARMPKDRLTNDIDKLSWLQALLIGLGQAVALIPGASRSGVTITAALFVGLGRPEAARFSFLLSLPAIFGAGLYELIKERKELLASKDSLNTLILATVVSGVVGYASIAWLMRMLRTNTTLVFILYRVALGLAILGLLWAEVLKPMPPLPE